MPGAETDITSTLSDLERKLQALETELATVGDPAAAPAPDVPAPALPTDPPAPLAGLYGQMAELERFRETLEESARSLVEEYRRLLAHVQVTDAPVVAAPTPPPVPPVLPVPPAPTVPLVSQGDGPSITGGWAPTAPVPPAPVLPTPTAAAPPVPVAAPPSDLPPARGSAPAPSGPVGADPTVEGQLTVDAGPFADIGTLSQFEQALGRLPGAQDVYVKGFEGDRALIDLQLATPIAFATQLSQVSPLTITVHEPVAGSRQLKVDLEGASDA